MAFNGGNYPGRGSRDVDGDAGYTSRVNTGHVYSHDHYQGAGDLHAKGERQQEGYGQSSGQTRDGTEKQAHQESAD